MKSCINNVIYFSITGKIFPENFLKEGANCHLRSDFSSRVAYLVFSLLFSLHSANESAHPGARIFVIVHARGSARQKTCYLFNNELVFMVA